MILFVAGFVSIEELGWKKAVLYYVVISAFAMFLGKMYGLVRARISLAKLAGRLATQPAFPPPLIE